MKSLLAAIITVAGMGAVMGAPAAAQVVRGIAIADQTEAVRNSSAFKNAADARPTTYKAQLDAAQAKQTEVETQLQPLAQQFNAERAKETPNRETLQTLYTQIQQAEQVGQQQINQILQPVALSEAYVLEQIQDKFDAAVRNAMQPRNISMVLDVNATISHNDAYDLTADITTALNALLPNAQIVPPPGWLPRAQREQLERTRAQQGQPATTTPAAEQPTGR